MALIRFQVLGAPDAATRLTITPKKRELIFQEDTLELYVGDGSTAGGVFLATALTAVVTNGANVGVGGVGVFKQLTGATLEFKNISSQTAAITVTNNAGTNEIELNIVPGQILTSALNNDANFQSDTQVQALVDAHANLTNNPHSVTATQVGLGNVDNTSDLNKPVSTAQAAADSAVQAFAIQRGNHTGTQPSSTISDFAAAVRNTVLTGISFATNSAVLATDTILEAIGKLQAQLNARVFGTEFEDFESTTQVNFSGALAARRTYTTASKPIGRYRVAIQIQTEPASTGNNDLWQLRVDGVQIGRNFENEAKDTGGDVRNLIYIVGYYQHTVAGTFDIEIWGGNESGTTELNGDVAEVWRVS